LRAFQAGSCTRVDDWNDEDQEAALEAARDAWRVGRAPQSDGILRRVRELLVQLRGASVPRCAVHGDFWRGNIAARDGSMRVYDWEWAALDGTPMADLWTYELAELRLLARAGAGGGGLVDGLSASVERVEEELRSRELDDRLALATLAPVLGALSFRIRRRLEMPDEMERHSLAVMAAAEQLLAGR
jgi:aminoglycoside phosphotransferase (APT) family kinase protein